MAALLPWGSVQGPRPAGDVELFADDFSRFPPGLLSAPLGLLNGAIQEYHYIEHRGVPTHPWRNPIVHLDSWAAGDEGDGPYLEQHLSTRTDLRSRRCSSPAIRSGATTASRCP